MDDTLIIGHALRICKAHDHPSQNEAKPLKDSQFCINHAAAFHNAEVQRLADNFIRQPLSSYHWSVI
jgi:hypothetical protein